MTESEFQPWRELSIRNHAEQMVGATGQDLEAAIAKSRQLLPRVLPDGLRTSGMYFFVVLDAAGNEVGSLWLGPHPEDAATGYVFDIEIHEGQRGRGLGRAAMVAAERFFAERGTGAIALWVAGGNDVAHSLYLKLGYRVVGTSMSKKLT
jgi:ribosomal protein S18 acetylase RimI-like enzyme